MVIISLFIDELLDANTVDDVGSPKYSTLYYQGSNSAEAIPEQIWEVGYCLLLTCIRNGCNWMISNLYISVTELPSINPRNIFNKSHSVNEAIPFKKLNAVSMFTVKGFQKWWHREFYVKANSFVTVKTRNINIDL